jgi:hypothetical protein
MAIKKEKEAAADEMQSVTPATATEEKPVQEVSSTEDSSATASPVTPGKVLAMNVSATLLHLEDGSPFPPRSTAELTEDEAERFGRFNLIARK